MKGTPSLIRGVKMAGIYNVGILSFCFKSSSIHLAQKTETVYNIIPLWGQFIQRTKCSFSTRSHPLQHLSFSSSNSRLRKKESMSSNLKILIIIEIVIGTPFPEIKILKHFYNTSWNLNFFFISVFSSHSSALPYSIDGGGQNDYHKPQFRESIFNEKNIWDYHARDNST